MKASPSMAVAESRSETSYEPAGQVKKEAYSRLYVRFVLLTLICSAVPLLLVGWVIYDRYSEFSHGRTVTYMQRRAELNRRIVELFLKERTSELGLVSSIHSLAELSEPARLSHIFHTMEREESYFTDLGVIDSRGFHLAYVGPYDLMKNDYSITFWFRELMQRGTGVFVSDMFMGYRKVPHFIIAVLNQEGDTRWILRATIDNEFLNAVVENTQIGQTGEVFLVNQHGFFQTQPRFSGSLMQRGQLPMERFQQESGVLFLEPEGNEPGTTSSTQVVAYAWLKEPHWMLVVKQEYGEAFAEVNNAARTTWIFLEMSMVAILIVSFLMTRHMIKVIKKRDEEAEQLNRQLLEATKMASLGELSSGVAHEINNPLAILLTESQVVRDLADETESLDEGFKGELFASLSQIDAMVERCNTITHNLLRFARRTHATVQLVDVNICIKEVMDLMERRAQVSGVEFAVAFEPGLPALLSNPSELQQVFMNLINNAIAAHEGIPSGFVHVTTRLNEAGDGIEVVVRDSGCGISAEHLNRIFDPFFTTKPVGQGTGLGLSISYSVIKELGGHVRVRSVLGEGTEFTVVLPLRSPKYANEEKGLGHGTTG
jgi:two-component system, NtrC family, sensor kinase